MILTLEQRFQVELPTGWRELPPAHVLSVGDWIFEWVDESRVAPERKPNLIKALGETGEFVLANLSDRRSWVAILADDGRIRGVASVAALSWADSLNIKESTNPEFVITIADTVPWSSTNTFMTIGGIPALVIHDFAVFSTPAAGPVVAERYVGTVFPAPAAMGIQLEILAEDTEVFDDIVAVGNAVLAGLRFVDEA